MKLYEISLHIFRLAIIRLALLFFNLVQSFLASVAIQFTASLYFTHDVENIFMWLCEHDSLWFFIEQYSNFADVFAYTNGIWILLFVITGPKFFEGFKNA